VIQVEATMARMAAVTPVLRKAESIPASASR
jgi:hypothetical protein